MTDTAPVVYNFDPETGEYLSAASCRRSPRGEGWITYPPSHRSRTHIPPPAAQAGHAACFRNGAWTQVEDHRDTTVYAVDDGTPRNIGELGPLPNNVTAEPRPGPWHSWRRGRWVEDTAAKAEASRPLTPAEKLTRIGMTTAELKELLASDHNDLG